MIQTSRIIVVFSVALVATSLSSIFARMMPLVSPVTISFWRLFVGGGFLWFYSFFVHQGALNRKYRTKMRISGIFLGLHFICFFAALKFAPIANVTLLTATAPIFSALFERWWLKRSFAKPVICGLFLAFLGIFLIQWRSLIFNDKNLVGNILAILGAGFLSIVFILSENIRKNTPLVIFTRHLYFTSALFLLGVGLSMNLPIFTVASDNYIWLILMGVVPTLLGHSLLYYTLRHFRPTVVSTIPLGEPILASFFAFLFFGESILLGVTIGGVVTLSGIYIILSRTN